MKCQCQDSAGKVCNMPMSEEEHLQDGMCSYCADNVYEELFHDSEYHWEHSHNPCCPRIK
jgi:hypothetical protein